MGKTKYGQNFLIDKNVAKKEIRYADLKNTNVVLEVGPGKGILTNLIAEKVRRVIAVEIDKNLVNNLKKNLPKNVILIHKDILKLDLNKLPKFNKIVSNLPFQISSPITFKILDYNFSKAVLIYQKDFAKRMVAKPNTKDYSRISVATYYKSICRIIENIPKSCFMPTPKVDSSIVEILPRKKSPFEVLDEKFFFDMTRNLFSHRRKKIGTILKSYYQNFESYPYLDKRVGELSPEELGKLCNTILKNN